MAGRDANRPQLDFPQLVADLIATLNLTGQLGILEMSDQVSPVFLIGSRGVVFGGENPTFASAEVFSGSATNPAANVVLADTGALPAGTYDVMSNISIRAQKGAGGNTAVLIEHRNAANAATLAILDSMAGTGNHEVAESTLPLFGYTLALNERIRLIVGGGLLVGTVAGSLFVHLRPTP